MTKTPSITNEDAQKLAAQIREAELACARNVAGDMDNLAKLIEQARAAKIHLLLGDYPTFAAWRRETRRERVKELRQLGISRRMIAAVLGVDEGTVRNDLKGGAENSAPARNSAPPRKSKADRVINAFEKLVMDADQWATLDVDRLKAVRTTLDRAISCASLKQQQKAHAASVAHAA